MRQDRLFLEPSKYEINIVVSADSLDVLTEFCRWHLDPLGDRDLSLTAELVLEEVVTNIIRHGYGGGSGPIELILEVEQAGIGLTIRDQSPPFDPLDVEEPEIRMLEGKRGLPLVQRLTSSARYEYTADNWNVLSFTLSFSDEEGPPQTDSPD